MRICACLLRTQRFVPALKAICLGVGDLEGDWATAAAFTADRAVFARKERAAAFALAAAAIAR